MSGWGAWVVLSDSVKEMSYCSLVGNNGAHYASAGKTAHATSDCAKTKKHHKHFANGLFNGTGKAIATQPAGIKAGGHIFISGPDGEIKFINATEVNMRDGTMFMLNAKADSNDFGKMTLYVAKCKTCCLLSLSYGKDCDNNLRNIVGPLAAQQEALVNAGC